MRPLTDEEMRVFFEKLQSFMGQNISKLIDRADEPHTFRLVKDRVYYISDSQLRLASNISRENLISLGTCFGKFSKGGKFRLHMNCLDQVNQYAKYKVWIKPGSAMSFLYGNNVTKKGLARMTDGIPQYAGIIWIAAALSGIADVPYLMEISQLGSERRGYVYDKGRFNQVHESIK